MIKSHYKEICTRYFVGLWKEYGWVGSSPTFPHDQARFYIYTIMDTPSWFWPLFFSGKSHLWLFWERGRERERESSHFYCMYQYQYCTLGQGLMRARLIQEGFELNWRPSISLCFQVQIAIYWPNQRVTCMFQHFVAYIYELENLNKLLNPRLTFSCQNKVIDRTAIRKLEKSRTWQ